MSKTSIKTNERRDQTNERIEHLIHSRQDLLVSYSAVAGLDHFKEGKPVKDILKRFLQVLVDYVAAAHFELYNRIEEGKERRQAVLNVAKNAHPQLTEITLEAIAFNDKYEAINDDSIPDTLSSDLSKIGEELALRFELENALFEAFMSRN